MLSILDVTSQAPSSILNGQKFRLLDMKTMSERLNEIFSAMRAADHWKSQADFARAITTERGKVSRSAVNQWLAGITEPKPAHVFAIADATGYAARWIATGQGPKHETQIDEILEQAEKLSESLGVVRRRRHMVTDRLTAKLPNKHIKK